MDRGYTLGRLSAKSISIVLKRSFILLALFHFQTTNVFHSSEFYLVCRKRQREQEIAEEEAAKKKKEWEKEWEVSAQVLTDFPTIWLCYKSPQAFQTIWPCYKSPQASKPYGPFICLHILSNLMALL